MVENNDYLYKAQQPNMTKRNIALLISFSVLFIIIGLVIANNASSPAPDDATQAVDRNGSIETAVSVEHADSTHDVLLTSHKVWLYGTIYKTLVYRDTIPALDTTRKDYQIFITVK
jgi:hypothetical protein